MRHIGDVSDTWISHQKKSARSTPADVLRVGEICLGISSPLIFYSPDDCCWRGGKVKEQTTRGLENVGRPEHNGGKEEKLFCGINYNK